MAHTQYAGIRPQSPAPTIAAVSGGNLSGSGTIEIAMQARNRAGWNLPTALISVSYVAGERIKIDIPATAREPGEDIHEFVFGIATTPATLSSIRQVAAWKAYDTDQVTPRALPATIYLSTDEHITVGAGQTVADLAALPTGTDLINGMIRQVLDIGDTTSRFLKYDAESTATVDNDTVFSAAVGRWLKVFGFSTYVSDTTAAGGCDRALSEIDPTTVIAPPAYPVDGSLGTAVRYWYFGSRNAAGPDTAQGTRVGVRVFDDGVERTQGFNGLLQITFTGYANPADGSLDTTGMTTGAAVPYQYGKAGAYLLEKNLPAGQAAEFAIAPDFALAEISDLNQGSLISINLRAYSQSGDRNLLYGVNPNGINPEGDRLRVIPDSGGVQVLSGSACTPVLCFPLVAGQPVTGLASNTADQFLHINGNGQAYIDDGLPGTSERIRAKISTASGRSNPCLPTSYLAVSSGDTLTVTVTHGRDIRADYSEPSGATSVIAGNTLPSFTPPQMAVYLERQSDGNIYEYLFNVTDTATQDVNILSLASADDTPLSIPTAPSANYSLFIPTSASFISPAGASDITAGNYRVSVAYVYDGGQATIIQHEAESDDWYVELDQTLADALSTSKGGTLAYRYNAATTAPPANSELRFNGAETELYISTTAQNSVNSAGLLDAAIAGSLVLIFNRFNDDAHRIFSIGTNTDNGTYHTLAGSVLSAQGTLDPDVTVLFALKGADGATGANGNTILSGSGAPSGGTGVDGDFYIDTTADAIYGPKTAGIWGSPTSLIGPTGATGTVSAASGLTLDHVSTPADPGAGKTILYAKSDSELYYLPTGGSETTIAIAPAVATEVHTTASLLDDGIEDFTLTDLGSQGLLREISLDRAAWVILYVDSASRTADATRVSSNLADPGAAPSPDPGSGVIAEVYLTGAGTQLVTDRGGRWYFNNDTPLASTIYAKVANLSGSTSTVQVTVEAIKFQ